MPVCAADSPLAFAPTFDRSTLKPAYGGYSVGELDFLAKRRLSMAIELLARPTCLHISLCVCVCVLSSSNAHRYVASRSAALLEQRSTDCSLASSSFVSCLF